MLANFKAVRTMQPSQLIKTAIRSILRRLPDKGRKVRDIRWSVYFWYRKLNLKFFARNARTTAHYADKVYWVDPERIEYVTVDPRPRLKPESPGKTPLFDVLKDRGRIYGGRWDLSDLRFEDLDIYQAIKARIENQKDWQESDFFHRVLKQIQNGDYRFDCRTQKDLEARCAYIDKLICSIKEHGYKLSREVEIVGEDKNVLQKQEEILCDIGRNGQYLFHDGRHRLAIAKILGIDSIPVRVLVRHENWHNVRELLLSFARKSGGSLYQPALHPDLEDLPVSHKCLPRFLAMQSYIENSGGSVLDIGANLGFFCHKFEDLGFRCVAVEADPLLAEIADRIRLSNGRKFDIIKDNLLNLDNHLASKKRYFDVALALNIFHHFLKQKDDYTKFEAWLKRLSGRVGLMFFEPHNPNERQMEGAYRNYDAVEFAEFVSSNLGLKNMECIYQTGDKRKLFRLY